MIQLDEKLRLKDQYTFVAAVSDDDVKGPLEWRRSLNPFTFEVADFTINTKHTLHESNLQNSAIRANEQNPIFIRPLPDEYLKRQISISAKVELDQVKDHFYRIQQTSQVGDKEKVFSLKRNMRAKSLIFSLTEGVPEPKDGEFFKSGAYRGFAGFWSEKEDFYIDISVSREVICDLLNSITFNNFLKVRFNLLISSFSYEVDDALGYGEYSRDLFTYPTLSPAVVENIIVISNNLHPSNVSKDFSLNESLNNFEIDAKGVVPNATNYESSIFSHISSSTRSVTFALWAIVLILLLGVFK